jgi:D-alanyl-D-alanine carboxypeptidase
MLNFFILSIFASFSLQADVSAINADFRSYVLNSGIGSLNDQAFCYLQNGKIEGVRTQKLQRIASLTKLLTTLLASETTDLHRRYRTRFFITKNALHIEGGGDPYFEKEKFLLLLKALNQLGHNSFESVTFSKEFLFYDLSLEEYEQITPFKTKARLGAYLLGENRKFLSAQWKKIRKFAEEEGVVLDIQPPALEVKKISFSDVNPLKSQNTLIMDHTSKPLHSILKAMNVQSKNLVAENIFSEVSQIKKLEKLLEEIGISSSEYKIRNGSGLPIISRSRRSDNLATCESVLRVILTLSKSINKHKLKLSDVVAINGGIDKGSFRSRFENYPDLNESVIAKTGTLMNASTLGGILLGPTNIPFAILNHTDKIYSARSFQDKFVSRMFDYLGPPEPESYDKISIFPWDDQDFLIPSR